MATQIVRQITIDGLVVAALAAADAAGDDFRNDSKTFLEITNDDVDDLVLTIIGQRNLPTGVDATRTYTIPTTVTRMIGPFPAGVFNRDQDGHVVLTYDDETDVTIAVWSLNDDYN